MIRTSVIPVLAAASFATAILAGCSASTPADSAPAGTAQSAATSAPAAPAAIVKDPAAIDGSTVTVPVKRELVFTVPEADAAKWTGTVADPTVAEFVPAEDGEPAGVHPLAEGETTAELTGPDGKTISFNLIITPGAR